MFVMDILTVVIPVRNHAPGTLGFIAQQGGKENRVKIKGSGCGQCEHRAAQVVGTGLMSYDVTGLTLF